MLSKDKPLLFQPGERYRYNNTGYDWTRPVLKMRADGYGYNRDRKRYTNADFLDMSLPHAAGSLYSTVGDLYKWHQALLAGKLLSKKSYEKMFKPGRNNYAYGWAIEEVMAGSGSGTVAAFLDFRP